MISTSSPIHKLNHDIVSTILHINANIFEDPCALQPTRRASQVCHRWRELALASPLLWARMMDFDSFCDQATNSWAHEVLRRAGGASIWIKVTLKYTPIVPQHTMALFSHVLENFWEQIEVLKMHMQINPDIVRPNQPKQWDPLYRSAPRLKVIEVKIYSDFGGFVDFKNIPPLFGDNAPRLFRFTFQGYKLNSRAAWLSNLRSVTISPLLTLRELLDAVNIMTQLESLRVEGIKNHYANINPDESLPIAKLSKLKTIKIILADLHAGAIFVQHLNVNPGCSLSFDCWNVAKADMAEYILESSLHVLAQFAERYLLFYGINSISLTCDSSKVTFAELDLLNKGENFIEIKLASIDYDLEDIPFPSFVHETFYKIFSFPCLRSMTALSTRCLFPPRDLLTSFLLYLKTTFTSIHTFDTDEMTVDLLLEAQDDFPELIMPKLQTLMLNSLEPSSLQRRSAIFAFLHSRQKLGKPIKLLDLTQCDSDDGEPMRYLEALEGLKVVWAKWGVDRVLEYVCGSGHPERLPYQNTNRI